MLFPTVWVVEKCPKGLIFQAFFQYPYYGIGYLPGLF